MGVTWLSQMLFLLPGLPSSDLALSQPTAAHLSPAPTSSWQLSQNAQQLPLLKHPGPPHHCARHLGGIRCPLMVSPWKQRLDMPQLTLGAGRGEASSLTRAPGPLPSTCSSCSLTTEAELTGADLDLFPPAGPLLDDAAKHILLQPPLAGDLCFVISI